MRNAGYARDGQAQHDAGQASEKLGDLAMSDNRAREALEQFRKSLGYARGLSESDPHNADWQRDLAAVHEKLGDALMVSHYKLGGLQTAHLGSGVRSQSRGPRLRKFATHSRICCEQFPTGRARDVSP